MLQRFINPRTSRPGMARAHKQVCDQMFELVQDGHRRKHEVQSTFYAHLDKVREAGFNNLADKLQRKWNRL